MKFSLKRLNLRGISLSNIYVLSMVITMIWLLMRKNDVLIQTSLFSAASLQEVQDWLGSGQPIFGFVLKERLIVIWSMFLLATTALGNMYVYLNVLWYGTSSGMFLAVVLMRYGIKGLLLLVSGMFPHYLIYVPAVILTMMLTKEKRTVNSKYFGQLFVITVVVIIGCILECYVNPVVVEKILKTF